jgi:hypothetical protein
MWPKSGFTRATSAARLCSTRESGPYFQLGKGEKSLVVRLHLWRDGVAVTGRGRRSNFRVLYGTRFTIGSGRPLTAKVLLCHMPVPVSGRREGLADRRAVRD